MTQLRLSLLGAPSIEVGRVRVETDTRKATALLAYLAVSEQPQRRPTLAALLWPDNDERKARGALRRTLSVLRSALGERWLDTEGETIKLDRANVRVDVAEFRRANAHTPLPRLPETVDMSALEMELDDPAVTRDMSSHPPASTLPPPWLAPPRSRSGCSPWAWRTPPTR